MRYERLPAILINIGVMAICFGLAVPFLDISSLLDVFVFVIFGGIVSAFVGLVWQSVRLTRAKRRGLAAGLILVGVALMALGGSNVHVWGLMLLVGLPATLLGVVLFMLGILAPDPRA
jgi:hypothetical protein